MMTGRQLKAARILLGLPRSKLAERMSIPTKIVKVAESVDGECPVTLRRMLSFRLYFEMHGIEFLAEDAEPYARFVS